MTAITVQCENLHKSFGPTAAVCGVNLEVMHGEIVALLGPSGCGKTTTMRLIGGLERPEAGRITIGGRVVAAPDHFVPPEQRQVGMVFQNYALFPHLSVADNVGYGLARGWRARFGGRDDAYTARVRSVLELVGLAGLEQRMPHELSGGQQQRVALARALAPQPQVLLLDEPFSGLDASLRDQVRAEVRRILRAGGTTVLVVTHHQEEALFLGDRVAVMNEGVVEQIDRPEAIFLAPASRFVAEFIGAAFFIDAVVAHAGLDTELGFLPQAVSLPLGTRVDVAARPDDLTLTAAPDGSAQLLSATYRGDSYLYELRLPSGKIVRGASAHTDHYAPGTRLDVSLTPGHALAYFQTREAG